MKKAQTPISLLEPIRNRWSPRAFDPNKPIEPAKLEIIFEAARWAASSYNEQPWRFIVGVKGTPNWEKVLNCLTPFNAEWNVNSPVIVLIATRKTYSLNGNPNRTHAYETGMAAGFMALQAQSLGVYSHQMGGVLPEDARKAFNIPDEYEVFTAMSFGYLGDPHSLNEKYLKEELEERKRKPLSEIVYGAEWSQPFFG